MMHDMELRHLRTFVLATELRNFSRTADVLGITQAAVSQQIAGLEKEFGVSLFRRANRAVSPTAAGRTLYGFARRMIDLADEAREAIANVPQVLVGVLRVAASTVPSEWLLPELLVEFRQLYPQVQPLVTVSDSAAAIRAVDSGEAELGIVGELPRATSLRVTAIARDVLTLVVPPQHAFAAVATISLDALRQEPLILREPNSGSRRCLEQALSQAGLSLDQLQISMEVNSNEAIRASVERGYAAAFLSEKAVAREIQDGRLIPVPVHGLTAERSLYLVVDPRKIPTRVARTFLGFLDTWRTRLSSRELPEDT